MVLITECARCLKTLPNVYRKAKTLTIRQFCKIISLLGKTGCMTGVRMNCRAETRRMPQKALGE